MKDRINTTCSGCGTEIEIQKHRLKYKHHFCSQDCFFKNQEMTLAPQIQLFEERNCTFCAKAIVRKPGQFKRSDSCFCNRDCYYGHIRSTKKRHTVNCFICDKEFKLSPKYAKERNRPCCSRLCMGKMRSLIYRGDNHPKWDDTLSEDQRILSRTIPEYADWRMSVFKRDGFACRKCGDDRGGNLAAHHILNYSEHPEKRTDVNNGITLCTTCHKGFHDKFGYTRNNVIQLFHFLLSA